MDKKVEKEELNNVSGGAMPARDDVLCKKCSHRYSQSGVPKREAGSKCNKYYEFQCPFCGAWN